jgi:FkbM family methyltransferase
MSTDVVRRLIRWLRGSRGQDHERQRAAAERRVEQARAGVRKWKARASDALGREQAAVEEASGLARRLAEIRRRVAVARREVPSVDVLRQTFSRRRATLAARVGAHALQGREERLLGVSAAYRSAVVSVTNSLAPTARKLECQGLSWWVPERAGRGRTADDEVTRLRFPYRGILQTRGVATGGIMLDLGANVGRMAVPRVILGDAMVAYCAEPDPVSYACLARNVIENGLRGLVLPDQTAIGDRDGSVRFLRAGGHGNFRVVSEGSVDGADVIDVPCATLDSWVERLQIELDAVTFIKVDVEGFERRVLAGASRVLQYSHIAWQMEIKPAGLRATGDDPQELYADLRRAFTHFIDLNREATGQRVRSIGELSDALAYIEPRQKTDVLLFSEA